MKTDFIALLSEPPDPQWEKLQAELDSIHELLEHHRSKVVELVQRLEEIQELQDELVGMSREDATWPHSF